MSFFSRTFQAVDIPVFILSGGLILLFVGLSLWDIEQTAAWVQTSFAWSLSLIHI